MPHAPLSPTSRPLRVVRPHLAVLVAVLTLVALALGTGSAAATAGAAPSAAAATGWIRAGHLAAGTPEADVRLTPYAGGRTRTLTDVRFGDVTAYTRVPVGLYTVALAPAGSDMSVAPMISRNVRVTEGSASTVIATGVTGTVSATVLSDDLSAPPAGQARVRLVSAATRGSGVDAQVVGGPLLAQDVTTGSSTGYADVPAQSWEVRLTSSSTDQRVTSTVPVRSGGIYTLIALDGPGGTLRLRAVMDSAGSTSSAGAMPSGGVDTGGGGLARASSSTSYGVPAGAVLASLAAALLLVVRRRTGTS